MALPTVKEGSTVINKNTIGHTIFIRFILIPSFQIADDIELMTGHRPGLYWQICWKFVSPGVMATVLAACLVKMFLKKPTYEIW